MGRVCIKDVRLLRYAFAAKSAGVGSLVIQSGANIKSVQNMFCHESAALTLDRYGHLYPSDIEAVEVAVNHLLNRGITRKCGQDVGTDEKAAPMDIGTASDLL